MQIHRRLVIYVQGYDPRGLAEYYRMFRREFRRTCELYGLTGTIGRVENDPERFTTAWDVTTNGDGWQVATRYLFLRWEDIIRKDFARPTWWKIGRFIGVFLRGLINGVFVRIALANWRFAGFIAYPFVVLLAFTLAAAAVAAAVFYLANALGAPLPQLIAAAAAAGTFVFLIRLTEPRTYLLYLCDDGISTHQFAYGQRPDWEERMKAFAGEVAEAVRGSDADEVVIVGHSSGSFLAVDVLDRALARDPQLGQHGPRVRLLTVGANFPIVGFHPKAQWFRDRLRRLAVTPDIDWIDYQSRKDVMNMFRFDPIREHGIELGEARRNPLVVAVRFRDIIKPENYAGFRWRFFRVHFQFLMANERPGAAYDYYLICCGPFDLVTRATKPDQVIAAMGAKSGPGQGAATAR